MTQAVEDGATRPVYYESRVMKINFNENILSLIDTEYDIMAHNADPDVIEMSKRKLGNMEAILGNSETINSLVEDIICHYENYRENLLKGKAMIVAYSRAIAISIYKRILEIRPSWKDKIAVVMTSSNNDPEEWYNIIGNKQHREELAKKFKDNDSLLKIVVVVDMWLTGFDVPSLATMYVYKPMVGHNLMQAIARVNRVFEDKEGGLVVDYIGIAKALKQAMNDYTSRDKKNYGDTDIANVAYPKFLEKLQKCRDLFREYDYSKFFCGNELTRGRTIIGAIDFLMSNRRNDDRENYTKEALLLKRALSLCSSIAKEDEREEAAFFEAVRVLLTRILKQGNDKKLSFAEINAKINELLQQSIKSDGVINLFSNVERDFSLFDPEFLRQISNMKEKNLAVELLKRLITEQVHAYKCVNLVKSEKFSEIMRNVMDRYLKGMLTNERVIEEMVDLACQIREAKEAGEDLGLSAEELALYDVLTEPQSIKELYTNAKLVTLTRELNEKLHNSFIVDWQKRDGAKASVRMAVRKFLKAHNYPKENCEDVVNTVIEQCELQQNNLPGNNF
ncbi:DUF3387 domain-containing protein [bacterium]|nr:DUF3387 domain-containing protein [bacterium]